MEVGVQTCLAINSVRKMHAIAKAVKINFQLQRVIVKVSQVILQIDRIINHF